MSLYQLARDGATDELATHLSESDSSTVRARAAAFLGEAAESDDGEAIDALIEATADDPDPEVRGAAVDALDQLGQKPLEALIATLADVDRDEAADWAAAREYLKYLSVDRPELRLAAATALGRLGGERAANGLAEHLDDPDQRVRARVARACGQTGVRSVVPSLAEVVETDDNQQVRREAVAALGAIGDKRGANALVAALSDPNGDVRRAAVVAIGEIGEPSAIEEVVSMLEDDDEAVRQATAFALIDLLVNVPVDRSHEVREAIVDELRTVDRQAGVFDPLVDIVESEAQARHRHNAVWLLGRIADEKPPADVIDALAEALCSSEEMVARFAATSLAEIGGEAVETELGAVLADEDIDEDARAKAAFALGKVGGDRVREHLEEAVNNTESETVRQRAFAALSKVGTGTGSIDTPGGSLGSDIEESSTGGG
jgi:HEAT repeat protein